MASVKLFSLVLLMLTAPSHGSESTCSQDTFVADLPLSPITPTSGALGDGVGVAEYSSIGTLNGLAVGLRITAPDFPDRVDCCDADGGLAELYTQDIDGTTYLAFHTINEDSGKITLQLFYTDTGADVPDSDMAFFPATFSDLDASEALDVYSPTAAGSALYVTGGSAVIGENSLIDLGDGEFGYEITTSSSDSGCNWASCPSLAASNRVTMNFYGTSSFSFHLGQTWGILALENILGENVNCPFPPPSPPPFPPPFPPCSFKPFWCNAYTCMHPDCGGCEYCQTKLFAGEFCARWCNSWTWWSYYCQGC